MKAFLKKAKAVLQNGVVKLCSYCPCPPPNNRYPIPVIGYNANNWFGCTLNYLTTNAGPDMYRADIDTWINPPVYTCDGEGRGPTVYCLGIPDAQIFEELQTGFDGLTAWWDNVNSTGVYFVAPSGSEIPPANYVFGFPERVNVGTDEDPIYYYFEINNRPENTYGIISGYTYEYNLYDKELAYEDKQLISTGEITVTFSPTFHNYCPYNVPPDDGTGVNWYHTTVPYKIKTIGISIYDITNDLHIETSKSFYIPRVEVYPCQTQVKYAIVGECRFTKEDCKGCLYSVSLHIWNQSAAENKSGKCINSPDLGDSSKSKKFTIIIGDFPSWQDAYDLMDGNEEGMQNLLKAQCGTGTKWLIQGSCTCDYTKSEEANDCTDCIYSSLSIICEDEFLDCVIDESLGTATEYHMMVGNFATYNDATIYLGVAGGIGHYDELMEDLKESCPKSCIFQWECTYEVWNAAWGDVTQKQKLCASPSEYEDKLGWQPGEGDSCTYIYTSIGDACSDSSECDWPDPPDKPTSGCPENCTAPDLLVELFYGTYDPETCTLPGGYCGPSIENESPYVYIWGIDPNTGLPNTMYPNSAWGMRKTGTSPGNGIISGDIFKWNGHWRFKIGRTDTSGNPCWAGRETELGETTPLGTYEVTSKTDKIMGPCAPIYVTISKA